MTDYAPALDLDRAEVMSYGGGWQTAAICVLIAEGKLPRPDRIVMADTGREAATAFDYLREHIAPLLAPLGLTVEIAPHTLATVDLHSAKGELLLPVFTHDGGKLDTYCSNEWKRRVVLRYLREQGYGPSKPIRMWLGFSVDEVWRAKTSDVDWVSHRFPLLFDLPTRRIDIPRIVMKAGLPVPHKSACWMCPHRTNAEWRDLPASEFEAACKLEDEIRAKDAQGGVYLHRSRVPLREADLSQPDDDQHQLFECMGGCWT